MDTPPMICAVCRRVLSLSGDEDGMTQIHTFQDQLVADHEPQPIPMPEGYREGRCDFCNHDQPSFALSVRDFEVPALAGHMSLGDWAVCADCARLIDTNRWTDLVTRVMALREARGEVEAERVWFNKLYRAVRKNITGSLRPL